MRDGAVMGRWVPPAPVRVKRRVRACAARDGAGRLGAGAAVERGPVERGATGPGRRAYPGRAMDPTPPTPWSAGLLRPARLALAALLAGACLTGCDDATPPEETDAVTGTTGTSTPDGYPEGPYGADVGEIMPNLAWKGFVDDDGVGLATANDYVDVDLATVRRGGARWALVHFGTVF